MDLGLEDIWFHDSQIHRVVENPEADELGFEVMYPLNWEAQEFAPRTIVFQDVLNYTVSEGPFSGRPTILKAVQTGVVEERMCIRIETNAGERTLVCGGIELRVGWGTV